MLFCPSRLWPYHRAVRLGAYLERRLENMNALARLRRHLWFERIGTLAVGTDMTEPVSPAIQRIIKTARHAP